MAWKVYGFMEGRDADGRKRPPLYGPLPRKRWIPAKGDKKHRVSGRSNPFTKPAFDKTDQARKGIEYAQWLAARDGIALPDGTITAVWSDVLLPAGKRQLRISCVTFGTVAPRIRIDIPNWNFIPADPVLEINEEYFRDLLAIAA